MPSREIVLQTQDADYYFFKADILRHLITYSTDKHILANEKTITSRRAFDIINMNRAGQKPESLLESGEEVVKPSLDLLDQENINRFDRKKGDKKGGERRKNDRPRKGNGGNNHSNANHPNGNRNGGNREHKGNKENKENKENNAK